MSRSRVQTDDTAPTLACSLSSDSLESGSSNNDPNEVDVDAIQEGLLEAGEHSCSSYDDRPSPSNQSSVSSLFTTNDPKEGESIHSRSAAFSASVRSLKPISPADDNSLAGDYDDDDDCSLQKENDCKKEEEEQYFNCWVRFMNYVRHVLTEGVTVIATVSARNPKRTACGITFLSFALLGIGLATNFNMDVAADAMYTPKNSRINEHKFWVEEVSGFPAVERNLRMIIHNDNGDGNVMNTETVEGVFEAIDTVRNTPGYEEACADSDFKDDHGNHTCRIRGVSLFWNNSVDLFRRKAPSDTDVILQASNNEYPDQSPVDLLEIMGSTSEQKLNMATRTVIVEARAFFLDIALPSTAIDFEVTVVEKLLKLRRSWRGTPLGLEFLAAHSMESETTRSVLRDIPLVPVVFLVMSCFTCLVFARRDKVRSRSVLGLGAVVCVFLSVMSGYGFMFICGVNFTSLSQILPFVMFGIGLDDAFIMIGAYSRTDPNKDVIDRIQETTRDIGLSIVLTTVTTTMAFGLGCLSNLPALYWLSFYAFTTMLIVFFYTITFFVALIVLDERRIQENRRDCCVCITVTKGMDDEAMGNTVANTIKTAEEGLAATDDVPKKKQEPELKADDETNNPVIRFMAMYADWLMKPMVKFLVLLTALVFAAWCAYSTSLFKQEFNVTEMLPSDSYAKAYMAASDKFGQRGWIVPSAYFRNVDQSDPDVQQQMEHYIDELVNKTEAISSQPPLFWLRHFQNFLTYDDRLLDLTFNQQVDIFLSHSPFKELFGPHVVRDEDTGDIIASRCVLYMDNVDVNSVRNQLKALDQQRYITSRQPANADAEDFNFFLWEYNVFTWDFYKNTSSELAVTTVLGIFSVCVIGFAFIPHWSAVCFLFPFISILYIDLMGFLQFTGNALNVVSYFGLVISIGLLVDFLMHMLLRYHECPGETREDKVKAALKSMGVSVLVGGLSTMLGVLPLAFSSSELMRTVFTAFMGMVVLGVSHGLIVLPVVLSLVGPTADIKEYKPTPKQKSAKQLDVEPSSQEHEDPSC